jgi:excisionase family DNA binding protein
MRKEMQEIVKLLRRIVRVLNTEKTTKLTLEEASKYTGLKESYLYKLTSWKLVKYYKPRGKKVYFKKRDLDKYIFSNPIRSNDQLAREVINYVVNKDIKRKGGYNGN